MPKKDCFKLVFYVFITLISVDALASSSSPFLTDNPEPVEFQHWEFSLSAILDQNNVADEEPNLNAPEMELNYGVLPNVQLHLIVPYAWALPSAAPAANGLGDVETGIKYRFIQETDYIPQVAIFPLVEIPTGDVNQNLGNGKTWFNLPIWLQKSMGSWTTYGGGGYAINSATNMRNYPFAGWLLQKDMSKKVTLGMEVFTQGAESIDSHSFTVVNVGGYYNFTKHFSLLFSAGHSIIGEQHLLSCLGLYWTGV